MLLKKLIIGAAAAATLGAGSAVLADENGSSNSGLYLRGQVGYGFVPDASAVSAVSVTPAGGTKLTASPVKFSVNNKKTDGVAGRVGVGYNFNQYFGLESGFALYSPLYRNVINQTPAVGNATLSNRQTKSSLFSIDLLGKATLPLNKFYLFAEGGAAYVHTSYQTLNTTLTSGATTAAATVWNSGSAGYIRPKAGVGVGYNLTDNIGVDVSYDRIFETGTKNVNDKAYVPSLNTAMVGLNYKF